MEVGAGAELALPTPKAIKLMNHPIIMMVFWG
jgi:hypothetical protein